MAKNTRYVGLDVHADSIAVAVAEAGRGGEVRSLGVVPNRPESVRKLVKKLGTPKSLRVCYEAGPCGYELYWLLVGLGVACEVVAPTLIPVKPGDRVKTDRRDALKLARCYRAGELTPVWVPDPAHEALRDLVRARLAAKCDQRRARQRLGKLLLRHGRRPPKQKRAWGFAYMVWLRGVQFEEPALQATLIDYLAEVDHAAARLQRLERAIDDAVAESPADMQALVAGLQALRGVAKITAVTIVAELGRLSRFAHPQQLMGFSGLVPSEYSTGGPGKAKRGGITKTGNSHLRRVLVEAAWAYRYRPSVQGSLRKRQEHLSEQVTAIGWKAQHRLHGRYRQLVARGKPKPVAITAIARELLGFVWAAGWQVEQEAASPRSTTRKRAAA
jgi:transposase